MKRYGIVPLIVLVLSLAIVAPGAARPGGHGKSGDRQQQEQRGKSRVRAERRAPRGERGQARVRDHRFRAQPQPMRRPMAERRAQPQVSRGQHPEQHDSWMARRSRDWRFEHRTWVQRGGYTGYRIPTARYRSYFGPGRHFCIGHQRIVFAGGYPRFWYHGYWFRFVDPWPEYWPAYWYDSDDVYIVYLDDGYYLVNPRSPGVRIAISVFLG